MKTNAVVPILSLIVFFLLTIFSFSHIKAETDVSDKNQNWGSRSLDDIHAVRNTIYDWIKAWQSKNLDSYMSYYSPQFHSEELDYKGWRRKKEILFKRPGVIFVEISNLLIFIEGQEAVVSFTQEYTDTVISDVGQKKIRLKNFNGSWKIVSEKWEPLNK